MTVWWEYLLIWVVLFGILGAAIGGPKGLGGVGFMLGALLGIIGVIIVAAMRPAPGHEPDPVVVRVVSGAPGWWPDPYGAHQLRYYDGATWTAYVSDQGLASLDPR